MTPAPRRTASAPGPAGAARRFRIVLEAPPPGVDFGLQNGRGSIYETVQTRRSTGGDLTFEFTLDVRSPASDTAIDFAGACVQGPRGQRFVYLDVGTMAGQIDSPWTRRIKIPLTGITPAMVRQASAARVLETRVPGTGRDGTPACATVKPFAGWTVGPSR
jgi:uncharacterized protein DUF5990